MTDRTGAEFASGGLALTLRDLARLGEALRCEGFWNGRRIFPAGFVADLRRGGDQASFRQRCFAQAMPNGSYRRHFHTFHDLYGAFQASGRCGQRLYVSPEAELVIAQFASSPGISDIPFEKLYADLHRDIARLFL